MTKLSSIARTTQFFGDLSDTSQGGGGAGSNATVTEEAGGMTVTAGPVTQQA